MIREALRSYARDVRRGASRAYALIGTHTADESVCAGADSSSSNKHISMRRPASPRRNQAVAALYLMRMSEPSLKFQFF